jgi:hypothetical protein
MGSEAYQHYGFPFRAVLTVHDLASGTGDESTIIATDMMSVRLVRRASSAKTAVPALA